MKLIFSTQQNTFEKINIPINNLEVNGKYKLYFSQSNSTVATNNNNYGCTILNTQITQTTSTINPLLWSKTTQEDIKKSINQSITFTATAQTMYWIWDFSRLQDETESEFRIYDVYITRIN